MPVHEERKEESSFHDADKKGRFKRKERPCTSTYFIFIPNKTQATDVIMFSCRTSKDWRNSIFLGNWDWMMVFIYVGCSAVHSSLYCILRYIDNFLVLTQIEELFLNQNRYKIFLYILFELCIRKWDSTAMN